MSLFILNTVSLLLIMIQPALSANVLSPMTTNGEGAVGTCPSQEETDAVIQIIKASIRNLTMAYHNIMNCGPGQWYQVASLNMSMSDPSQQCPSTWREYNSGGIRACGRPATSSGSCPATSYATSRQYSRVCGKVIGYQIGSTDAFGFAAVPLIDSYYVYGVSITHGTPRNHVWTYAAGLSEGSYAIQRDNCPCSNPSHPDNVYPPSFVGNNYYCESGNPTDTFMFQNLYSGDKLWDGQQCEGECCSNGKSPPWFSVELPNPTTDDIEVRICNAESTARDDVLIQLLELYIQ